MGKRGAGVKKKKKQNSISDIREKWGLATYGKKGCWGLKKEKQNSIPDMWEKWGRHIWGNGGAGDFYRGRGGAGARA